MRFSNPVPPWKCTMSFPLPTRSTVTGGVFSAVVTGKGVAVATGDAGGLEGTPVHPAMNSRTARSVMRRMT
jgi:hypothetical protein